MKSVQKATKHAQNVGALECWIRIVGGAAVAVIGFLFLLPTPASFLLGITGIVLILLGLDFVMTGITGYCPLYQRLGWSTLDTGHR